MNIDDNSEFGTVATFSDGSVAVKVEGPTSPCGPWLVKLANAQGRLEDGWDREAGRVEDGWDREALQRALGDPVSVYTPLIPEPKGIGTVVIMSDTTMYVRVPGGFDPWVTVVSGSRRTWEEIQNGGCHVVSVQPGMDEEGAGAYQ